MFRRTCATAAEAAAAAMEAVRPRGATSEVRAVAATSLASPVRVNRRAAIPVASLACMDGCLVKRELAGFRDAAPAGGLASPVKTGTTARSRVPPCTSGAGVVVSTR